MTTTPHQPTRSCPECGSHIARPRRNQTYCSAACRSAARDRRKHTNRRAVYRRTCAWCSTDFESPRYEAEFCSTLCQQGFNNFWKSQGPKLAKAMHLFRVKREQGAFTKLCRTYSDTRHDENLAKEKAKRQRKAADLT